jgi:hypothetical protein
MERLKIQVNAAGVAEITWGGAVVPTTSYSFYSSGGMWRLTIIPRKELTLEEAVVIEEMRKCSCITVLRPTA